MGRSLVKLADDAFVVWSTAVDAPVSHVMTKAEAIEYDADAAERADQRGHGYRDLDPDFKFWEFNRAGPNEANAELDEILRIYAKP